MVRYKKRYFVFQLDRQLDVMNYPTPNVNDDEGEPKKKKKRGQKMKPVKKRSLCDPKPLEITDFQLSNAIKDIVLQIHGDFGRAAVTMGKSYQQIPSTLNVEPWQGVSGSTFPPDLKFVIRGSFRVLDVLLGAVGYFLEPLSPSPDDRTEISCNNFLHV